MSAKRYENEIRPLSDLQLTDVERRLLVKMSDTEFYGGSDKKSQPWHSLDGFPKGISSTSLDRLEKVGYLAYVGGTLGYMKLKNPSKYPPYEVLAALWKKLPELATVSQFWRNGDTYMVVANGMTKNWFVSVIVGKEHIQVILDGAEDRE